MYLKWILILDLFLLPALFAQNENKVLQQELKGRIFIDFKLKPVHEIIFEDLENIPFRPTFCSFDENYNIYIFDNSKMKFHKFLSAEGYKKSVVFGNGKGEGPGEFIKPTDFKLYKGNFYVADVRTGRIEVYSIQGKYIKSIKLSNHSIPYRITLVDDYIYVIAQGDLNGKQFSIYDLNGIIVEKFNFYVNETRESVIINDSFLSNSFNDEKFYHLPLYEGVAYCYYNDIPLFAKKTIDSRADKSKLVSLKEGNVTSTYLKDECFFVNEYSLGENFIFIRALDTRKNESFFDFYEKSKFSYLFSIKDFPAFRYADIKNDKMCLLDDLKLSIYNIKDLNDLINKKMK